MYNRIILLTLLWLLPLAVLSQRDDYSFVHLTNKDGLSNNQVDCIFKDSRGLMWFGTNYGINRYDGYEFKVFTAGRTDSLGLVYNTSNRIQEDAWGNLWVMSNNQYVVYDRKEEVFRRNITPYLETMGFRFTPALVEIDDKKAFFAYHSSEGLYCYNPDSNEQAYHLPYIIRENDWIIAIKRHEESLWLLYQSGYLERFNLATGMIDYNSSYLSDRRAGSSIVKNLFVDNEGCPWIFPGFNDRGALYYDFSTSKWFNLNMYGGDVKLEVDFVRAIVQDENRLIWIATDHGGLNLYNKKTGKVQVLKNEPNDIFSLAQNSAISLYCDNEGFVWVGTYKNGISYYHPHMFKFGVPRLYSAGNTLPEMLDTNRIYEDSKGNVWIGTNGGGLIRYNKTTGHTRIFTHDPQDKHSLSADIIISILEDSKGTMWFGTFLGGLNRLEGDRFIRYMPQPDQIGTLSDKSIYGLVEDKQGNIWIGTLGGGVNKLNKERNYFTHFTTSNTEGLVSDYILSMFSPDGEKIYLCTSVGMSLVDAPSDMFVPYLQAQGNANNIDMTIYNACEDSKGLLWIATDNGLAMYDKTARQIHWFTREQGMPDNQVVSIVEDDDGNIWVGTKNGLVCIYKSHSEGKDDYRIVSFDEEDGMPSTFCNQNALYKAASGRIAVGTVQGFFEFDPRNIRFNEKPPRPMITVFRINNKDFPLGDNTAIELEYNQNNLTIHYSAMNFMQPKKNSYRYMLKGFDKDWNTSTQHIITYSNLNPGRYELLLYVSNSDGVWTEEPLLFKIEIDPPFWFSWWAYLIYTAIFLFLSWMIIRWILSRQQKKFEKEQRILEADRLNELNEMKFRFFTNISHEFRTPLSLIINPVEKLLKDAEEEEPRSLLKIIRKNTLNLLELVNQLLDFRKLEAGKASLNLSMGDVIGFIKDISYSFADMANEKHIDLSFASSLPELYAEFDRDKLKKIVTNLLSNAFKFTPSRGKIRILLSFMDEENRKTLSVAISDTGIGIDKEHRQKIFERFYRVESDNNPAGTGVGLHLANEYARLHGGHIEVESEPGKGSVFTLFLPLNIPEVREVINSNTPVVDKLLLIVDDNDDFRDFLCAIFSDTFSIITASDGTEAWEATLDKMPDLIISDVMMPRLDGFELTRILKKDIRTSHIPVILLTAKASEENKYTGIDAGAEDYVSKPFNMDLLKLKVDRLLEQQKKLQEKFRSHININAPEKKEALSPDEEFINKAVVLVEKNLSNAEFLVEDLGREMGMSRVHFYKKIVSLTSKSPSEFIRLIRLKHAAELLKQKNLYVNEVAYQVGFNDPKYFRKYFKEEFGVTPNEYKKQQGC